MRECLNCGYWNSVPEKSNDVSSKECPECGHIDRSDTFWGFLKDVLNYMKEGWAR